MTMHPIRRLYIAVMSDGRIGIGALQLDAARTLVGTVLPAFSSRDGTIICLQNALLGVEPEEVVVSLPYVERRQDIIASAAAVSVANAFQCATTRIINATEVQDIEHAFGSARDLEQSPDYAKQTVQRLHAAYRAAQRHDVAFGTPWSFSADALLGRCAMLGRSNEQLVVALHANEVALAECEASGIEVLQ